MTVEMASGVHADLECTVPMATVEGQTGTRGEITLPIMAVEMEGMVGSVISSSIKLPMMTVEMAGKTEHFADCDVSVPMMQARAELMVGKTISGSATVPMMAAQLSSYEDIDGDIDVTIPMMMAGIQGSPDRAACDVLRYEDP